MRQRKLIRIRVYKALKLSIEVFAEFLGVSVFLIKNALDRSFYGSLGAYFYYYYYFFMIFELCEWMFNNLSCGGNH